ncbi:MAG TPA: glycosyltransferase family 2 protein [Thermoplasmata archaeon]|nr:glycosyltransferase family 2 protein [Thermoplasmata archaeon]
MKKIKLNKIKYITLISRCEEMKENIRCPKVSFIMPVLNEEKTIEKCLDSIMNLDYPKDKIEILIAEGPSTDNTHKIVESYAKKCKNIKLLENPTGNTAVGRNICIEHATGKMLMNYSGHVVAEKNLLRVLALKLLRLPKEVAGVGCSNISPEEGQNFVGKVSGVAFSSFMGGKNFFPQNAVFNEEKFVDHMSFTCYRKEVVEEVKGFDPEFWCGQDAELDIRIKKAGYKILYTPETRVYHFKRAEIKSLFRQMYRYGVARAKIIKKHPDTLRLSHLLGTGFVTGILVLLILLILGLLPLWFVIGLALLYFLISVISSLRVTRKPSLVVFSVFLLPHSCCLRNRVYQRGFLQ